MPRQVLVIDSNSAVQAIALLALKNADCAVKALTDGAKALEAIQKIRPQLVLCAKEIAGINALELCKQVRKNSPETLFILLAPAETPKEVVEEAKKLGYDDVLFKPFKSNRLKDSVLRVLEGASGPALEAGEGVSLHLSDKLTRTLVERLLSHLGLTVLPSGQAAIKAALLIADANISQELLNCGRPALVLCDVHEVTEKLQKSVNAHLVSRPLTHSVLVQTIGQHVPIPEHALRTQHRPLEMGEVSLYAAKTSAAIFAALVSQPCFQQRNWEQAGDIAKEEVMKLGRELDGRK